MRESLRKLHWTEHSKIKMKQYRLSKQKLFSILEKPERVEKGIVPGTIAIMRTNQKFSNKKLKRKKKAPPGEIWIMYQDAKTKGGIILRKIISAWRYPGVSTPGQEIPIPEDIKREILSFNLKDFK